jgi:hypothetical protein
MVVTRIRLDKGRVSDVDGRNIVDWGGSFLRAGRNLKWADIPAIVERDMVREALKRDGMRLNGNNDSTIPNETRAVKGHQS